jgi:hypothetical protein
MVAAPLGSGDPTALWRSLGILMRGDGEGDKWEREFHQPGSPADQAGCDS